MNRFESSLNFDELPDSAMIQIRVLLSCKVLPYSATTIWRKSRIGEFPLPIKVSKGITAWRVKEIRDWLRDPTNFNVGGKRTKGARHA